ncbi:MAG: hypothetical protein KME26_30660 [Oscillatoria princeps RMCB-10]|nr:hypothetical protein [Oscillatoria princeps RMCB-10]
MWYLTFPALWSRPVVGEPVALSRRRWIHLKHRRVIENRSPCGQSLGLPVRNVRLLRNEDNLLAQAIQGEISLTINAGAHAVKHRQR